MDIYCAVCVCADIKGYTVNLNDTTAVYDGMRCTANKSVSSTNGWISFIHMYDSTYSTTLNKWVEG